MLNQPISVSRGMPAGYPIPFGMYQRPPPRRQPTPIGPPRRISIFEYKSTERILPALGPVEFLDAGGGTTCPVAAYSLVEGLCLGYYGFNWQKHPMPELSAIRLDTEPYYAFGQKCESDTEEYMENKNSEVNRFPRVPNVIVNLGRDEGNRERGFDIFRENPPVWMKGTTPKDQTMGTISQTTLSLQPQETNVEKAAQRTEILPSWRHPLTGRGYGGRGPPIAPRFENRKRSADFFYP